MLDRFKWVSLRDQRMNFGLLEGRIILVFGGKRPVGAIVVDCIQMTDRDEGIEGNELRIGAWGFNRIVSHLYEQPAYRNARTMRKRLSRLIPGGSLRGEMIRATLRASLGRPHVGGDTSLWLAAAKRQLAWQPSGPVQVRVEYW